MATRSTIAVMHGPVIKAISVHWDGYLEHVGSTLFHHYSSERANMLIALGDMSVLGTRIDPTLESGHSLNNPEKDVCVFYGRDNGESNTEYSVFESIEDFVTGMYMSGAEYFYLMRDGQWFVSTGKEFTLLQEELAE